MGCKISSSYITLCFDKWQMFCKVLVYTVINFVVFENKEICNNNKKYESGYHQKHGFSLK